MGQALSKEEISQLDAVTDKIKQYFTSEEIYFKYGRTSAINPDDNRLLVNVYIPKPINADIWPETVLETIDNIKILVNWIDPVCQQDGYYDKRYDEKILVAIDPSSPQSPFCRPDSPYPDVSDLPIK